MTGVDLGDEDAAFVQYLNEQGWNGEVGEKESVVSVDMVAAKQ